MTYQYTSSSAFHFVSNITGYKWPDGLTERFLNLQPRPTLSELMKILDASVLQLDSQNQYTKNSDKKALKQDAERHQRVMEKIIASRQ
jgi:hypothetical protein